MDLKEMASGGLTRRTFLAEGTSAVAAGTVAGRLIGRRRQWWAPARQWRQPQASQLDALRVLGRTQMRLPGTVPNPALSVGADTLPQIDHVVVLMMENHSYDNILGMLGRGARQQRRGDGFTLAPDGLPSAVNPYPDGRLQRAFRMPTTCQLDSRPSQEWTASHNQYDNGKNDGFVRTPISYGSAEIVGPVAMGYWTEDDLPLTYALASTFPVGDRWFCSCLAQTDPNRRYLIAATSQGMTDDIGTSPGNSVANSTLAAPAKNGTIFQRLSDAGISWADYNTSFPTGATMELYPSNDGAYSETNAPHISKFFSDAKAGSLPQFSLLDPNYSTQSQENPQNITVGEGFLGQVIDALRNSPLWRKTVLILTYDEHGGYYDHVPPPKALAPDSIPPVVNPGQSQYDGFARYGFRVPAMVIGPYAKRGYVSHLVYDHTSILAFVERKWNLQSMTYRDANANDLTDFLDLTAMNAGQPTFPELPALVPAGDDTARLACSKTGPGTIPPPIPSPLVEVPRIYVRRQREIVVELETSRGSVNHLEVELIHSRRVVARRHIGHLGTRVRRLVLHPRHGKLRRGTYTVVVRQGTATEARRVVHVH